MKVLITIRRSPGQRYLVNLYTKALVREVRDLIDRKRHAQAIATVCSKGDFEREVSEHEIPMLEVDLILSEGSANWDLVK